MPAVPGGVFGYGLFNSRGYKPFIEPGLVGGRIPIVICIGVVLVFGLLDFRRIAPFTGMISAVVVDQIRRIGREQDGFLSHHQPCHVVMVGTIAAKKFLLAEAP